jgi:hypothetical protein
MGKRARDRALDCLYDVQITRGFDRILTKGCLDSPSVTLMSRAADIGTRIARDEGLTG